VAMSESFAAKLDFVLKALSLSRGRVAAELGLNKSVVGRWITGAVKPAAGNLSRLSALVARRIPRFTSHDWNLDIKGLAALLGVERGGVARSNRPSLSDGLPLRLSSETRTPIPMAPGNPARHDYEYERHGVAILTKRPFPVINSEIKVASIRL